MNTMNRLKVPLLWSLLVFLATVLFEYGQWVAYSLETNKYKLPHFVFPDPHGAFMLILQVVTIVGLAVLAGYGCMRHTRKSVFASTTIFGTLAIFLTHVFVNVFFFYEEMFVIKGAVGFSGLADRYSLMEYFFFGLVIALLGITVGRSLVRAVHPSPTPESSEQGTLYAGDTTHIETPKTVPAPSPFTSPPQLSVFRSG